MNIILLSNYSIGCVPFYVKRALEKIGHNVFPFSPDYNLDGWTKCAEDVDVTEIVKNISIPIDLILCVEASTGTKFFPKGLDSVPAPTAWWGIDNHLNYRWHKEYANLFDIGFFAQKEYLHKAQKYGLKNSFWLPPGCDEEFHRDRNYERIYDVSFVGNLTPNRKTFFNSLGVPVNLVSGVYLDKMGEVYSKSKIVLNISAREDLNMRVFEVMCSGALLVTQRIDAGINELFEEGRHFVFHDIKNAGKIVRYYLDHPEERVRIADAGKEIAVSENTYAKRVETILAKVKEFSGYTESRRQKFNSYKIYIQESLVYKHRSFKLLNESRRSFNEAMNRNKFLTIFYLLRFSFYRLIERIDKMFKKNF
ncbi:MAG: glycosyltransferase family 1 protein [Ignavibacteriales bacterium]|nr:glycosyltransferase family 1 protein [Ignavibacteriales bacterium]